MELVSEAKRPAAPAALAAPRGFADAARQPLPAQASLAAPAPQPPAGAGAAPPPAAAAAASPFSACAWQRTFSPRASLDGGPPSAPKRALAAHSAPGAPPNPFVIAAASYRAPSSASAAAGGRSLSGASSRALEGSLPAGEAAGARRGPAHRDAPPAAPRAALHAPRSMRVPLGGFTPPVPTESELALIRAFTGA